MFNEDMRTSTMKHSQIDDLMNTYLWWMITWYVESTKNLIWLAFRNIWYVLYSGTYIIFFWWNLFTKTQQWIALSVLWNTGKKYEISFRTKGAGWWFLWFTLMLGCMECLSCKISSHNLDGNKWITTHLKPTSNFHVSLHFVNSSLSLFSCMMNCKMKLMTEMANFV